MLEFTKNAFRGFIGFILWVNLILFAIGGGIIGSNTGAVIIGVIIGLILGLFFNIILGGFIATVINIDKNLEIIKKYFTNNSPDIEDDDTDNIEELIINNKKFKITKEVNLFEEPNKNSKVICSILEGEKIVFLNKKEIDNCKWYYVKDNDNNKGWCLLDI